MNNQTNDLGYFKLFTQGGLLLAIAHYKKDRVK